MSILQDLLALRAESKPEHIEEGYNQLSPDEAAEAAEKLEEIHEVMIDKMREIKVILERLPNRMEQSAKAYWFGHMSIALGGQHGYMTAGHEDTMAKLIEELKELGQDEDEDHAEQRHADRLGDGGARNAEPY